MVCYIVNEVKKHVKFLTLNSTNSKLYFPLQRRGWETESNRSSIAMDPLSAAWPSPTRYVAGRVVGGAYPGLYSYILYLPNLMRLE